MITSLAYRWTRINKGYKQLNKNDISFFKSYYLTQLKFLLHNIPRYRHPFLMKDIPHNRGPRKQLVKKLVISSNANIL